MQVYCHRPQLQLNLWVSPRLLAFCCWVSGHYCWWHAWKTQCACVPSLLPARICQCLPPSKLYAIPKQTRFRPQNSKKEAPHTKDKLRISWTQSFLIALVSLFCTTYFPPCTKGENHVWKSTLALAALRRSHCCCFGHHVAELGQCEQRKRPMHAKWKNKDGKTLYWTTLPAVWSSQPCCWFAGKLPSLPATLGWVAKKERALLLSNTSLIAG